MSVHQRACYHFSMGPYQIIHFRSCKSCDRALAILEAPHDHALINYTVSTFPPAAPGIAYH